MFDLSPRIIRTSTALTSSYVAGTVIDTSTLGSQFTQLNILVAYTKGSSDAGLVKVEYSLDNTTYYQVTNTVVSGASIACTLGEFSLGATGNYVIELPIRYPYIKISAKGSGADLTNAVMAIKAIIATN